MTHLHLYYYDGSGEAARAGRYETLQDAQRAAASERKYEAETAEVEERPAMRVIPKRCESGDCLVGA